jgi:CRISPR-associated protein Csx14
MSVLLACSLSLVGRPQDRLYHLLVTPGFESSPNFYYPPKKPAMMTGTDQSTKKPIKMPSNNIELSLAEIPFVRFGSKLDKQDRGLGYRRLVELTQQSLEDKMAGVRASLYVQRNVLNINGMDIRLQPAETMLYAHFARKKASCRDFTCRSCWKCHETWEDSRDIDWTDAEFNQDSALAGYRRNENTVSRKGVDWKPRRSTLNKKILQALDDKDLAENFQITPANDGAGKRGRRYGIRAGKLLLSVVERD